MIWSVLVAFMAAVALAYVSAPLRRGPRRDLPDRHVRQRATEERKRAALDAIVDLEAERDLGKLSEPDFEVLRDDYERVALQALKELDALGASDDPVEAEIAARRDAIACPHCGAARGAGSRCPRCGR